MPRSHVGGLREIKETEFAPQRVSPRNVGESEGSVGRNAGQETQALEFAGISGRALGFPQVMGERLVPKLQGLSDPS